MRRVWEDGVMRRYAQAEDEVKGATLIPGMTSWGGGFGRVDRTKGKTWRQFYGAQGVRNGKVKLWSRKKNTVALLVRERTSLEKVEDRTTLKTKLFLIEGLCGYFTKCNCMFAGNWTCFQFLRSLVSDPKTRDIPSYFPLKLLTKSLLDPFLVLSITTSPITV